MSTFFPGSRSGLSIFSAFIDSFWGIVYKRTRNQIFEPDKKRIVNTGMGAKQTKSFTEIHRRRQIIDIAIEMIATRGYQQTTLTKIAAKAGFSKGVIFYYFKNKEDLVKQTGAAMLEELRTYTIKEMKQDNSDKSQLEKYIRAYFDFIRQNRQKFLILMELGFNLNSSGQHSIFGAHEYRECRDRLHFILGKDNGTLPREGDLPAVIQGMLDGVSIQWVADIRSVDLDLCQTTILNMIDSYLTAQGKK